MTVAPVIALHGGAGVNPVRDYAPVAAHLGALAEMVASRLAAGMSARDAVCLAVTDMEDSGLYVAGRGAGANRAGVHEFDASLMDGATGRAGAVAAVQNVRHPILAARAVMEETPHVLLAGDGATAFARMRGLAPVPDPVGWFRLAVGVEPDDLEADLAHGTVGAVALDTEGRLAAATSTGGTFGKLPGRVGDTPLPGVGTWADGTVAISCTGIGEHFILAGGAGDVAARVRYGAAGLEEAAEAMLARVAELGGDGGLIALDRSGTVAMPFNSPGMKRAVAGTGRETLVAIT
ncbi:MAG: isoaspartyl peptidase/L-asparaginase family protein [Thermaurantiacus sp.]